MSPAPQQVTNTDTATAAPRKTGRRARTRMVRMYDREHLKEGTNFRTADGHRYGVHPSGAFVRMDKDPRSPKQRKKARREARERQAA